MNDSQLTETICKTGRHGNLFARLWRPSVQPIVGCAVVVHGLGEHGGRYRTLATELARAGWASFVTDLPGHGESPGRRGHISSYFGVLQDLHSARGTAAQHVGDVPQVMIGHSMGGNLAVNYALRRSELPRTLPDLTGPDLTGLVLSAPMFLPSNPPPRAHILAAWLTGYLVPWLTVRAPVDTNRLTNNPETAKRLRDDTLRHGRISVYLATQMLAQGRYALDAADKIDLPTLVMHGEDDPITSFRASESFAVRAGARVQFQSFPGMLHEIFNESDAEVVFDRLRHWLDELIRPRNRVSETSQ